MTLVATPADADANSYLTVADADALAGDDLGPEADAWLATTVLPSKEKALKRATREIDAHLSTTWQRYSSTQRLLFPRSIDTLDGDPVIPVGIQRATYQQAIFVLRNAAVIAAANSRRAQNLASASEPQMGYSQGAEDGMNVLSPQALHYLSGFSVAPRSGSDGLRSVRVGTGFIGTP